MSIGSTSAQSLEQQAFVAIDACAATLLDLANRSNSGRRGVPLRWKQRFLRGIQLPAKQRGRKADRLRDLEILSDWIRACLPLNPAIKIKPGEHRLDGHEPEKVPSALPRFLATRHSVSERTIRRVLLRARMDQSLMLTAAAQVVSEQMFDETDAPVGLVAADLVTAGSAKRRK